MTEKIKFFIVRVWSDEYHSKLIDEEFFESSDLAFSFARSAMDIDSFRGCCYEIYKNVRIVDP